MLFVIDGIYFELNNYMEELYDEKNNELYFSICNDCSFIT